jgi:hypothetical protein
VIEEFAQVRPEILEPTPPQHWQANELLEGITPEAAPGKFQGIYRIDGNPSTAIMLNDSAWYVRYETDTNGVGRWAIIDPENPNAFSGSMPVRLNAQGQWKPGRTDRSQRWRQQSERNVAKGRSTPATNHTTQTRYKIRRTANGTAFGNWRWGNSKPTSKSGVCPTVR